MTRRNDSADGGLAECTPHGIPSLRLREVEVTDLHSLLGQVGENAAVMQASQADIMNVVSFDGEVTQTPETLKLLDYTRNQEIPLQEHYALSGIGWVDGLLHVQLHYIDNGIRLNQDGTDGWYPVTGFVFMQLENGLSPNYAHRENLPGAIYCVNLGTGADLPEWQEYIFACDPSEVQEGKLEAQITRNETVSVLEGDWSVRVPLRMIQYGGK